jgi:titin
MMHAVSLTLRPVKPDGLALTGSTLSWTDQSLSETAFAVQKSSDGGSSWTEVGRIERVITDQNTKGEVLGFDVGTWVEGDQFRVVAQNTVGDTWDYSDPNLNEIAPETFAFPVFTAEAASDPLNTTPPPAPPAAPTGVTAALEAGPQVNLTWTDASSDETGFVIQRSTDDVTFSDLATVGADLTSYVDTAVVAGNTYTYQVAAVNAGGSSSFTLSNSVSIAGPQPPAAPEGLEATFEDGPQITLAWTDNAADETGFVIQRSTDGTTFSDLASVGADVQAYDDPTVLGAFTYTYRVAAVNANGTSAYAVSNAVTVPPDVTPPAAPSNLAASNIAATALTLTWQDNSNNEAGFRIQVATNSSFSSNLVEFTVAPDVTSLDVTGLRRNTRYYIRVQAFNAFNEGLGPFPWSPVLNVRTANR